MMKSLMLAVALAALPLGQIAWAQSGFGSENVTSGETAQGGDSFDITGLEPEDQTPAGKFTTAAEISPILEATRGNWAAVREYEGHDLVYFSHLLAWRCGLKAAKVSINEAPLEELLLPECHMKFQQPNVILDDEALMTFQRHELGSVKSIRIDLLLDDLTTRSHVLLRENILIP